MNAFALSADPSLTETRYSFPASMSAPANAPMSMLLAAPGVKVPVHVKEYADIDYRRR